MMVKVGRSTILNSKTKYKKIYALRYSLKVHIETKNTQRGTINVINICQHNITSKGNQREKYEFISQYATLFAFPC